jgi:hypothetical protein
MPTINYTTWIDGLFNCKVLDDFELDWSDDWLAQIEHLSSEERLRLITGTFQNAGRDLARFSDEQAGLGLNFLTNEASDDWLRLVYDFHVPLQIRLMTIQALYPLYRDLFSLRCDDNLNENNLGRLNWLCYMFWDAGILYIDGFHQNDPDAECLIDAIFDVLEKALALPHRACQHSALHGLGHSIETLRTNLKGKQSYSARAQGIIDAYLKMKNIDDRLRKYARQARTGYIM